MVHQFGVDYIELEGMGDVTITFTGSLVVPWWAASPTQESTSGGPTGRRQRCDAHARVRPDWARAGHAHGLTWYHLETDYDYAYVQVSPDGGRTWDLLPGTHTTTLNPVGSSYGHALNGVSGGGDEPRWVEQTFDLSHYAGGPVLVRFEVVYDDAINYPGAVP